MNLAPTMSPIGETMMGTAASYLLAVEPPTAVDAPGQSCLEAKDGLQFAQLLTSAFRNHPHINNVLTHISLGQWDRIEAALANLLTAPIDTVPVSPLERNLLCLLWEEGGITGRIVKPLFLDLCRTSLPPLLAARCVAGTDALSSLANGRHPPSCVGSE